MLVKVPSFGHLFTQQWFSISYSFYIKAFPNCCFRNRGLKPNHCSTVFLGVLFSAVDRTVPIL